jgi:GT2 family glycosyltransferase
MKTNRNKFLHNWKEQIAIVVPHLHFDVFLKRIYQNVQPLTVICVWDGKKPNIPNLLYVSGGGSFAKSSNIGIAYAQSLGFSHVCLINDDVEIFLSQIIELLDFMDEGTDLISPGILDESGTDLSGIYVNDFLGYTRCISETQMSYFSPKYKKNIHHLGACMLFRSIFRLDERFPHGMEDIEFSKRIRKNRKTNTNTKIVSKVLVFHKGQGTISHYSYNNEKKSLQGKFLLFEHVHVRLIVNSCLHVLLRGHHKKERFLAIKDALRWSKNRNI